MRQRASLLFCLLKVCSPCYFHSPLVSIMNLSRILPRLTSNDATLEELSLRGPRMGEDTNERLERALRTLATNTAVKSVILLDLRLTRAEIRIMADALRVNRTITLINLAQNVLDAESIQMLFDALRVNGTVRELNLSVWGHRVDDVGNDEMTMAILAGLAENTCLTDLLINGRSLRAIPHLLIDALRRNTTLRKIGMAVCQLGDMGVCPLADLLKTNTTLTSIQISDGDVTSVGFCAIAEALKVNTTLTELTMYNNTEMGDEGAIALADALRVNNTLTKLILGHNGFKLEGVRAIADALKINSSVKELSMFKCFFGDDGAKALAEMLPVNTTLTDLIIWKTGLTDVGTRFLFEAAKLNVSLTKMDLDFNDIQSSVKREIQALLDDPVRAAWATGEADTKPAIGIPLAGGE
eukprot:m.77675 g.77675  ORF g.77675 m.77675 type:complete len:411 (+) comp13220_c0_seq2:947-2179(+)